MRVWVNQSCTQTAPSVPRLVDEEEFLLLKDLKEVKAKAREAFDKHSALKCMALQTEHNIAQCKLQLVTAFEDWWALPLAPQGLPAFSVRECVDKLRGRFLLRLRYSLNYPMLGGGNPAFRETLDSPRGASGADDPVRIFASPPLLLSLPSSQGLGAQRTAGGLAATAECRELQSIPPISASAPRKLTTKPCKPSPPASSAQTLRRALRLLALKVRLAQSLASLSLQATRA